MWSCSVPRRSEKDRRPEQRHRLTATWPTGGQRPSEQGEGFTPGIKTLISLSGQIICYTCIDTEIIYLTNTRSPCVSRHFRHVWRLSWRSGCQPASQPGEGLFRDTDGEPLAIIFPCRAELPGPLWPATSPIHKRLPSQSNSSQRPHLLTPPLELGFQHLD